MNFRFIMLNRIQIIKYIDLNLTSQERFLIVEKLLVIIVIATNEKHLNYIYLAHSFYF